MIYISVLIIIIIIFFYYYKENVFKYENFVNKSYSPYCASGLYCRDYRDCNMENGYCVSGCCEEFPKMGSDKYIPSPINSRRRNRNWNDINICPPNPNRPIILHPYCCLIVGLYFFPFIPIIIIFNSTNCITNF